MGQALYILKLLVGANKMNIKETYAGFTDKICPGKFGFFIILDDSGVALDVDKVCKQAIHFPRVIIMGDEPFNQKEDIAKLIKKNNKGKSRNCF